MTDTTTAGCGCQYDAGGRVFVDRCVCAKVPARDHAAADQAHRDDLARDAAKMWAAVPSWGRTRLALRESNPALADALDRLAAEYGEKP